MISSLVLDGQRVVAKLTSKVSKEITDRNDCSGIDKNSGNFEGLFSGISRERLLDEHL